MVFGPRMLGSDLSAQGYVVEPRGGAESDPGYASSDRLGSLLSGTVCVESVARTALSLPPGPEVGVVVVFGLTADRNGVADFPILWASRWVVDCIGSAGT